jgi:hypothetical protein
MYVQITNMSTHPHYTPTRCRVEGKSQTVNNILKHTVLHGWVLSVWEVKIKQKK